jgi:hypothetical protein
MKLTKKELLRKIDAASAFEEKAIPIYSNHLAAALERSEYPPKTKAKIKSSLKILSDESKGHIKLLELVREICLLS